MKIGALLKKIPVPAAKLPPLNRRMTLRFFLWASATYMLALFLMLMLIRIAFSGNELVQQALINGQRLVIDISKGEIEGKINKTATGTATTDPQPAQPAIPNSEGLNPVPFASLIEQTDKGVLPIANNGVLPWKYYSRPPATKFNRPMVAVVFTNIGLSRPLTEEVMKLPPDITIGFSPYANDTGKLAFSARREGFESVVDLPMQTDNYPFSDPGFFGMLDDLSAEENIGRIHSVLRLFPGFVGMLAPVGETMTANKDAMKPYLTELKKRGLLFLYLRTAKNAEFEDMVRVNQFFALGADLVIDDEPTKGNIEKNLQYMVDIAKKQGYSIGIAHSYPTTTEMIAHWADSVQGQGVDLVPVTAIAKKVFP